MQTRFPIDTYAAEWNPRTNTGRIFVTVQNRQIPVQIQTADQFIVMLLLLNKTSLLLDSTQMDFELPFRPVGT